MIQSFAHSLALTWDLLGLLFLPKLTFFSPSFVLWMRGETGNSGGGTVGIPQRGALHVAGAAARLRVTLGYPHGHLEGAGHGRSCQVAFTEEGRELN